MKLDEVGVELDQPVFREDLGEILRPHYHRVTNDAEDARSTVDVGGFGVDSVPHDVGNVVCDREGFQSGLLEETVRGVGGEERQGGGGCFPGLGTGRGGCDDMTSKYRPYTSNAFQEFVDSAFRWKASNP